MMQGKNLQVKQGKMMDQDQKNRIFYKPLQPELYHPGLSTGLVAFTWRKNRENCRTGKSHEHSRTRMHPWGSHKKINAKSK